MSAHEQLVLWDAFSLPDPNCVAPLATMIDRFPASELPRRMADWKALAREGWDVTLLVAPDRRSVVALAAIGGKLTHVTLRHQPKPHQARLLQALGSTWNVDPDAPACCPDCDTGSPRGWTSGLRKVRP